MTSAFPKGAKVRFTQERLSILTPRDRQSLAGRIGVIQTDGKLVTKPTVYFPAEGGRVELRLFRVDPRQLEMVEAPPTAETSPYPPIFERRPDIGVGVDNFVSRPIPKNTDPAASNGGDKLSQDDLDKMFS